MKWRIVCLLLGVLLFDGCVSKSKVRLREKVAFQKGQQQAATVQQQALEPVVWFRGLIRHSRVPWTEGLTLAQGIVAAEYTGAFNPGSVRVIRRGQNYPIDIKLLLRGEEVPLLEAGDIVEVLR